MKANSQKHRCLALRYKFPLLLSIRMSHTVPIQKHYAEKIQYDRSQMATHHIFYASMMPVLLFIK